LHGGRRLPRWILGRRGGKLTGVEKGPSPITVLLADDDLGFLESLEELVEEQPELSVVGRARNGLDVLELADRSEPDAVVIDVHMPLLDGVTTIARLRRDHPSLCVIAITGDREPDVLRAAEEAGADAVLLKEELVGTLVDRLSSARTQR